MINEVKTRNIISGLIPPLSATILLTQKQSEIGTFSEILGIKDMYSASWKQVKVLSDIFCKKWRSTCLDSLQKRHKWSASKPNLKTGDIILLREKNTHRNLWPTGIVERPIERDDKMVRKAAHRTIWEGKATTYFRPVTKMVLLME